MIPVAAKLHRHPNRNITSPIAGTPIADENFAMESKIAVAKLRSSVGNQYPTAFAFAGNVGASPTPNKRRAPRNPVNPEEIAAPNEATLHNKVLIRPTSFTPKRSRIRPEGSCNAA